jgi:hypothetical protein
VSFRFLAGVSSVCCYVGALVLVLVQLLLLSLLFDAAVVLPANTVL